MVRPAVSGPRRASRDLPPPSPDRLFCPSKTSSEVRHRGQSSGVSGPTQKTMAASMFSFRHWPGQVNQGLMVIYFPPKERVVGPVYPRSLSSRIWRGTFDHPALLPLVPRRGNRAGRDGSTCPVAGGFVVFEKYNYERHVDIKNLLFLKSVLSSKPLHPVRPWLCALYCLFHISSPNRARFTGPLALISGGAVTYLDLFVNGFTQNYGNSLFRQTDLPICKFG